MNVKRIINGLVEAGLNQDSIAEELRVSQATISRWLSGSDPRGQNRDNLIKLATKHGVLDGAEQLVMQDRDFREVRIASYVEAGKPKESLEWPDDQHRVVYVPDLGGLEGARLFGAEVKGPSMNKVYPEGTFIVFTDNEELQEAYVPGKNYVFERTLIDGELEYTVKTYYEDQQGGQWLLPQSDDPLFQQPVSVSDMREGEYLKIVGRVVYSIRIE